MNNVFRTNPEKKKKEGFYDTSSYLGYLVSYIFVLWVALCVWGNYLAPLWKRGAKEGWGSIGEEEEEIILKKLEVC
jgi:hypothetical protein